MVPRAPTMHTQSTGSALAAGAARATAPPAASMIAPASCGGGTERMISPTVPVPEGRANDRSPSTAITTAAHTHSTPAISMGPQYEAAPAPLRRPSATVPEAERPPQVVPRAPQAARARRGGGGGGGGGGGPGGP